MAPLPGPPGMTAPLPMPGALGPGPVPGVSSPASAPPDRMAQLAELLGQTKAEDTASALEDMTQAMALIQGAAKKDSRLAPIVQEIMAVINKTAAAPAGGGLVSPLPTGAGSPMPPMPPGMM